MAEFRIEDYRQPWETGPHWELKKEFIEKYSEMFPEDRLLCLAQAYSNVVLMNCSYPDPVMRQISYLSQPLQMRKRFQGMKNSTNDESPKHQQKREKLKSIYENSGRPLKQIKFCASEDQTTISSNIDQANAVVNHSETKGSLQIESREKDIVLKLGFEFINKFVELLYYYEDKVHTSKGRIAGAAQSMKPQCKISYEVSAVPNSPKNLPVFCSEFCIKNCMISKETAFNKKEAMEKSAQSAVNILIKIFKSNEVGINDSDLIPTSPLNKNEMINDTGSSNNEKMKVLQIFSEKITNRTKEQSAVFVLEHITTDANLQKFVSFAFIPNTTSTCQYICKFFINNILISSGLHMTTTHAKEAAIESGFTKLENLTKYKIQDGELVEQQSNLKIKSPHLTTDNVVKNSLTEISNQIPFILNSRLFTNSKRDGFVLLDNLSLKHLTQRNAKTMLQESVSFSRQKFEYKFEEENPLLKKAHVMIDGRIVACGIAPLKETAKTLACENAINSIRKMYYTLKVKNEYIDGYIIQRNQLFQGESFTSGILTESNIGCKILKCMGWTGGGLGSSGIVEPIEAQEHHSFGEGLGYGSNNTDFKLFKRRIDTMLQDYKNTNTLSSLVFSKEFSKEERKIIHQTATRYNLQSVSRGTGENRFLTVRHKFNVRQLLQHLANHGGSSSRYELIDASETPFTF